MKKTLLLLPLALLLVAGCQSPAQVGQRYRVERSYWRAARALQEMQGNRAATPADAEKVKAQFMAVIQQASEGGGSADTRHIAGQSWLQVYDLYLAENRQADAARTLDQVLLDFQQDSLVFAEGLWRRANRSNAKGDSVAALDDLRHVTRLVKPAVGMGNGVAAHVMDIPLKILQHRARLGDTTATAAELSNAVHYYYRIAADASPAERLAARAYAADALRAAGRGDRAMPILDSLLFECRRMPDESVRRPELLMRLVSISADELGDLARGAAYLDTLAREYPRSTLRGPGQLMRARILVRQHKETDAAQVFSEVSRDQTLAEAVRATALVDQGRLAETQNNWDEAQRCYREASTNYPLTPAGMQAPLLAVAHFVRGSDAAGARTARQEARQVFEKVLSRYPDSPYTLQAREYLLAQLTALEDWKAAAALLTQMSGERAGGRQVFESLLTLAQIHEKKMGDRAAAAADYRKILVRFPNAPFKDHVESEIHRLGG